MVFRAARDNLDPALNKRGRHRFGVLYHLLLIRLIVRTHGFFEADGLSRNHVHQRTALTTRENRRVKLLLNFLIGSRQNQPAAGTAQGLVRDRKSTRLNSSHVAISY